MKTRVVVVVEVEADTPWIWGVLVDVCGRNAETNGGDNSTLIPIAAVRAMNAIACKTCRFCATVVQWIVLPCLFVDVIIMVSVFALSYLVLSCIRFISLLLLI